MRLLNRSWHSLPNAEYIKAVLWHAKAYPHKWTYLNYGPARSEARSAAVKATHFDVLIMSQTEVSRLAIPGMTKSELSALMHGAEDAFLALAAWDDCAYILGLHPDVVRTLAGSGNYAAILLLPGIIAMKGDNDASDGTSAEGARPKAI